MKSRQVNQIMFISGILIFISIIIYLLGSNNLLLDSFLIAASIVAGVPTFLKAWQASKQKMFSIELLVSIAVIGALIIGEYTESAAVTFLFLLGLILRDDL